MRLRCGNLEEENKYWVEEGKRKCIFCRKEKDNLEHYIEECEWTKEWFIGIGENKEDIKVWICNDRLGER